MENDDRDELARLTLAACEWDVEREEARMTTIDGKLTQLVSFAAVSISVAGGLGGSVLAADRLSLGFAIALGATLSAALALLLASAALAFSGLSPKIYKGVGVKAAVERVKRARTDAPPPLADVLLLTAGTRVKVLARARKVNALKATAAVRAFRLTTAGLGVLVLSVATVAVGSVV